MDHETDRTHCAVCGYTQTGHPEHLDQANALLEETAYLIARSLGDSPVDSKRIRVLLKHFWLVDQHVTALLKASY